MPSGKFRVAVIATVGLFVIGVIAFALITSRGGGEKRIQRIPDGSMLEIRQVALSNGFHYSHQSGNRLVRLVAPLLPPFIKNRLSLSSGSFGFGGDGDTNLFVITVNRSPTQGWWTGLRRLVVFDEQGNAHDACWGASTLGMPGEVVHGWQLRAYPRRSQKLGLQFLSRNPAGPWEVAAEFKILNPSYRNHPQWTPEPWPVSRSDGDLEITLREFRAGAPFQYDGAPVDEKTTPRGTSAEFDFRQNGKTVTNWTVQKVTVSDATGNRWSPFLGYGLGSATNGTLEFAGALWPGENAWKLDLEFVRTAGFDADEFWESPPLTIPLVGVVTNLDARFQRDGATVDLVGLAAPQADHPEPFKWIAKYWGNQDKDKVISLAARVSPALGNRRLKLVRAVDQNGTEAKLLEHRNEDSAEQAFLLKPDDGAITLKLEFTLQRGRFVHFLARPELVDETAPGKYGR